MGEAREPRGLILNRVSGAEELLTARNLPVSTQFVAGIDVGGTWFRAAATTEAATSTTPLELRNSSLSSVQDGINRFFLHLGFRPACLCIGITGERRVDGEIRQPNVPSWWPNFNWKQAQESLGIPLLVYNDLGVAALSMSRLGNDPRYSNSLVAGQAEPGGRILTVGLGTGLGDAFLDGDYLGQSEAGHGPFAPRDQIEDLLLQYARKEMSSDIVSFEDLISGGRGIPRLYRFFVANPDLVVRLLPEELSSSASVSDPLDDGEQTGEVISRTACSYHSGPIEGYSLVTVVKVGDILGTYLGARAVSVLATGGVKLVGGVVTQGVLELWRRFSAIEDRIRKMGVHSPMTASLAVDVISHPHPGLVGALEAAVRWKASN